MTIMQANVGGHWYFYCGALAQPLWSADRAAAVQFADETTARADMADMPMAYTHYQTRARAVPA